MSFGHPYLLLTLLVVPLALALFRLAERRRMRYAVRYTNVDVLASVAGGRSRRRLLAPVLFLLAIATLCVAVARPHVPTLVASDRATVVLVLDVSGSMQANDVKPSRLAAAQAAIHRFLDKVPGRVRVGLILFAGEADVATPPTTDHELVGQAVDNAAEFHGFGGTAIGDAIAVAVQLGLKSVGIESTRGLAAYNAHPPASSLVSILFLSDGHQTRGTLLPLQGADRAKQAGIPVFTIALGTKGGKITNFPGPFGTGGGSLPGFGFARSGLEPDPRTLRAIAQDTGGLFFQADSANKAQAAYDRLGSRLGREPGHTEVTDEFAGGAAALLVVAGILSALWAPRLP